MKIFTQKKNCYGSGFLVIGPNLTLQHIHWVSQLKPGEVNRMQSSRTVASGKGVNVARALKKLGADVTLMGFAGGFNGQRLISLLQKEQLSLLPIPMKSESRSAVTVLEDLKTTEIIEASPRLLANEASLFLKTLKKAQKDKKPEMIIVTGTSPITNSTPFCKLLMETLDFETNMILDLSESWVKEVQFQDNQILKINFFELCSIFSLPYPGNYEEKVNLVKHLDLPNLLVTDEDKESVIKIKEEIFSLSPPKTPKIVNPIGAGDVCCASLAYHITQGLSPRSLLEKSLELASRSCMNPIPGDWNES